MDCETQDRCVTFQEFFSILSGLASKLPPLIKYEDNRKYIQLGDKSIQVNDKGVLDLREQEVKVVGDKDGGTPRFFLPDGSELTAHTEPHPRLLASGSSTPNQSMLDDLGKVFTRADLLEPQVALLNLYDHHAKIIGRLRRILQSRRRDDIIGLVTSASIIRLEDERVKKQRISNLRTRLTAVCGSRGSMIYNLFRSKILELEVIPGLSRDDMVMTLPSTDGEEQPFLDYWDSALIKGYPSAYFVKATDTAKEILSETTWRLDSPHVNEVRIFSRKTSRNKKTLDYCKSLASNLRIVNCAEYQLGHHAAITVVVRSAAD
jgi:hypothetical protein